MSPARNAATERQVEAADPTASTWLSANAGSGKTRVLTDRVARLLLVGTPPQNVLCLTYTKAAASEMQNRLFDRLGEWAMRDDAELRAALETLGADAPGDAETLARARRLFARAIETPGGLKIQTIHSFCAAILRRFPREAGLAPGFREMDEAETAALQAEILNRVARNDPDALAGVADMMGDDDPAPLCAALRAEADGFDPPLDAAGARRAFGLPADADAASIRADALGAAGADDLAAIAGILAGQSKTMQETSTVLRAALRAETEAARFEALCAACLVKDLTRRRANTPTKPAVAALGPLAEVVDRLAEGLLEACERLRALHAAERTVALHRFADAFLPAYAEAKAAQGVADFDDLIDRTLHLLDTPGVGDWVLYRLDGTIDHVLVDEAQDTSPRQWRLIDRLTREFSAGAGRHGPGDRTVFVVGDHKQSIYSFQGANPDVFEEMGDRFGKRIEAAGARFQPMELEYSFRSAPEILRVVEASFPDGNRAGLGRWVQHRAFRRDMPGRVDLWPVEPKSEAAEVDIDWTDPVDRMGEEHEVSRLATKIAGACRDIVETGQLPDPKTGGTRPATAGDILVLVQRRGALFDRIIGACKTAGLAVAGADVLKLGEELVVRDLVALLSFLDLPEDDLSLAALLRSPLCEVSEAGLYDLAAGRPKGRTLWQEVRARGATLGRDWDMLNDMRAAADFLRPYELLERVLTRHEGRARFVARLGEEATDAIDALLDRALDWERTEIPGLTGFLAALEGAETQVKRRAEGRGDKLRVMTVHGAKGLESPVVILPDCGDRRKLDQYDRPVLRDGAGPALWSPARTETPQMLHPLRDAAIAAQKQESRRLLYVAMTRAESWLIVAAAGEAKAESWHAQVAEGMARAGAETHPEIAGGLRLQSPLWPDAHAPGQAAPGPTPAPRDVPLPEAPWARTPVAAPARPEPTLAPSDLGGAKALGGAEGRDEEAAMARGTRIHLLLEHLPGLPAGARPARAAEILDPEVCPPDELAEVARLLDDPDLAPLFARTALTEVPFTAPLSALGGRRLHGTIDRLLVERNRVLAVDFKTNVTVPDRVEDTPDGLLRQMGAYAAALAAIYPDRAIETAILWTRSGVLMPIPERLAADALARAAT